LQAFSQNFTMRSRDLTHDIHCLIITESIHFPILSAYIMLVVCLFIAFHSFKLIVHRHTHTCSMYKPEEKKNKFTMICSAVVKKNKYCLKYAIVNFESPTNTYIYMTAVRLPGPQFPNPWFIRQKIKSCVCHH